MPIRLRPDRSISIPSLGWLDSSLLAHRPRFNSRPVYVAFVVEKVALGHDILQILQVFPVSIIVHYFVLNSTLYRSIVPINSVLKEKVCVLCSSFLVHICVQNLNKPQKVTKNTNLCTY